VAAQLIASHMKQFDWTAFMRQHPVLSDMGDAYLRDVLADDASTERSYAAGDVIIREGESGDSIFLIGSGSAEAVLSSIGGQTIVLSVMLAGEIFGEMGLFERRARSATVRARERSLLLEINGEQLRQLTEAHRDLGFRVLLNVSERLRSKNESILALHLKGVEGANRAKDEFMAMLGHELRNPLGAISAAIHVLDKTSKPDDTGAELRGIIVRQTRHLSRLLDDLLDVSKLIAGKIDLQRRPEDLKEVVLRVVSSFKEVGRTTRHQVGVAGENAIVYADSIRLEQIVSNLLDNALKYTPPGGVVDVTVTAEPDEAVLRIRDTGVGIDASTLPRIFDLFVQANPTSGRAEGGLGVGLTLVKRLVELHGGSISASSAGPQRGSEFVVRIPRTSEVAMAPPASDNEARSERRRRILIIEDNLDVGRGLRRLLESWGHQVEVAATGGRGLEIWRNSRPDIVLVDLGLPDIDGYAVARAVRSEPEGDAVVLVTITGYGGPHDLRRARDAGFDAHFTKPLNPQLLARIIWAGREGIK
jgi:signal transduction histidine kinase/ActR/RegA family two-component response regulator